MVTSKVMIGNGHTFERESERCITAAYTFIEGITVEDIEDIQLIFTTSDRLIESDPYQRRPIVMQIVSVRLTPEGLKKFRKAR